MSASFNFVLFVGLALICSSFAIETCSYKYCQNHELTASNGCVEAGDKDGDISACTQSNKLYISYKTGTLSFSTHHKCCNWALNDISSKSLYCVKKIRARGTTCYEGTKDDYKYKVKTIGECTKFSCLDNAGK